MMKRGNADKSYGFARKLTIPIKLAEYVLSKGLYKPFGAYLVMKGHSCGRIKIRVAKRLVKQVFRIDRRTVNRRIEECLKLNWIGTDGVFYFVRSFKDVQIQENQKSRWGVPIEFEELRNIRGVLFAILVTQIIHNLKIERNQDKRMERRGRRVRKKWRTKRKLTLPFPIPINLIKAYYGFSTGYVCKLKREAVKTKLIHEISGLTPLTINNRTFGVNALHHIKELYPEISHRIRLINKILYIQNVNKYSTKLYCIKRGTKYNFFLKKKQNRETYNNVVQKK